MTQQHYAMATSAPAPPAPVTFPAPVALPPNHPFAPGPTWQQPPAPKLPGASVGTHLKRAFDGNVVGMRPSPREYDALMRAGVAPRLHGLFVWRRSLLLVSLPLITLSVFTQFWKLIADIRKGNDDIFTPIGMLTLWLPPIALIFVPLGTLVVLKHWTSLQRGSKALIAFWLVSVAVPLVAAIIPLDYLIDLDGQRAQLVLQGGDVQEFDTAVLLIRLGLAMKYALALLPVVLSVPGGVLKGASRIKNLFPSAPLPGWFLVAVAPFYSMFMIVVFVLIDQFIGNAVLLAAVALLAFTPWLLVIKRRVFGRPMTEAEAAVELPRAGRLGMWLTITSIALMVIFALTAYVDHKRVVGGDGSFFSTLDVLQTIGEMISRGLVTTVVFSTLFAYLVFAEWRNAAALRAEVRVEHDVQMRALGQYLEHG